MRRRRLFRAMLAVETEIMQAHKLTIVIPESHEVTLKLPMTLPTGQAEVFVLAGDSARDLPASDAAARDVRAWLVQRE